MGKNEVLKSAHRENPSFSIGDLVERSHGLKGAEVATVVTHENLNLANPLEVTHLIVDDVIIFRPTSRKILPSHSFEKWPIREVKHASQKYIKEYINLRPTKRR